MIKMLKYEKVKAVCILITERLGICVYACVNARVCVWGVRVCVCLLIHGSGGCAKLVNKV